MTEITMAILGCGNMGTAILDGILSALKQQSPRKLLTPHIRPSRFIACVNRPESVTRLENRFRRYLSGGVRNNNSNGNPSAEVHVWQNNTAQAVKLADIVLLACQPSQAASILADHSLRQHLSSKLLLSICVGVSAADIQKLIYGDYLDVDNNNATTAGDAIRAAETDERCYIVHAMPNTASSLGASATILSTTADTAITRPVPREFDALANWIFASIGTVTHVPPSLMNVASVTGASTVAFFATALEGVVRGARDMGLSETDALHLAAQAMKGTAEMVLQGREMTNATTGPNEIREKVMTPNGCTAKGVGVLQDAKTEEAFAEATRKAVERVFELGKESASRPS